MQLLFLLLVAGVVGYFIARSRLSKPIDDATGKVAESSRSVADKTEGWWRRTFGKKDQTAEQVIEGSAVDAPPQPAEKQTSRRKSADTTPESSE
ncbi:MAG: hypothetical protein A2W35_15115 [Chloroflexi bacterium RBG_16_57_11]|nr:MAG: hypothetical protein A2W35_15115 [Chloroflexi bacterium RBG_16_57_11]